jgi:membrane fusion protein (multidrug efflux system)
VIRKRAFFAFAIAFFSFSLLSCGSSERKKEAAAQQRGGGQRPPARVDVYVVQTSTISESIEVPGSLVAGESTEIHPEVSGRIVNLNIREGAVVSQGSVIAKLYDGDLQAQKRKLQVQLQIAQQTENRYAQLQQIGGISKEDYAATALQVSNLRADLDIINTSISRTVVRAPFTGKLGLKQVSAGAYVTPASVLTTIQKTTGLRVDFNVPEKYTSQLRKGQYVNFTVEGNNRNYTAVIMATESGISEASRTLTIRAQVRGDATGLVPGGFAKVKIAFEPDANALLVPTQAIVPQARGKKVYLLQNGQASFVDVTTGIRDSARIQIVSGLKAGDSVIVTGLLGLKPDAKVQLRRVVNGNEATVAPSATDSTASR